MHIYVGESQLNCIPICACKSNQRLKLQMFIESNRVHLCIGACVSVWVGSVDVSVHRIVPLIFPESVDRCWVVSKRPTDIGKRSACSTGWERPFPSTERSPFQNRNQTCKIQFEISKAISGDSRRREAIFELLSKIDKNVNKRWYAAGWKSVAENQLKATRFAGRMSVDPSPFFYIYVHRIAGNITVWEKERTRQKEKTAKQFLSSYKRRFVLWVFPFVYPLPLRCASAVLIRFMTNDFHSAFNI